MNNTWPKWAVLRAEQVAKLPPDERGPWGYGYSPCRISNEGKHQTEFPFFFHCRKHLEDTRQKNKQTTPWPTRDQGICVGCGNPAELRPTTMNHRVACLQAECTNNTVARINTKSYCQQCSAKNGTLCNGRTCRGQQHRNRVQGPGCCPNTQTGTRRHCSVCCSATRQRKLDRQNRTLGNKAGTNSGTARRRKRDTRRSQTAALRRAGINNQQIADKLNVSLHTVERDIAGLKAMTRSAIDAKAQKTLQRWETISQLSKQGLTTKEIAQLVSVTEQTVRRNLPPPEPPARPEKP